MIISASNVAIETSKLGSAIGLQIESFKDNLQQERAEPTNDGQDWTRESTYHLKTISLWQIPSIINLPQP